ncbi:hypothetical protein EVAR_73449_1 [Eumeta japonica]|uniref:Uncharacterized protein n=1 Tax=Eumeta variegata TaxID=151549 RepID=A0A4C1TMX4_EUMVA|nr:hypothetical protein EVAR_73449_1 [Eumeta japonica]
MCADSLTRLIYILDETDHLGSLFAWVSVRPLALAASQKISNEEPAAARVKNYIELNPPGTMGGGTPTG